MPTLAHLRRVREREAWTQGELAERAGVSRGTVARAEAGFPTEVTTARKLAAALGVRPSDLMAAEPSRPPAVV